MPTDFIFILALISIPVLWYMATAGPELDISWPPSVTIYTPPVSKVTWWEIAGYLASWDICVLLIWYAVDAALPPAWVMMAMIGGHGVCAWWIGGLK